MTRIAHKFNGQYWDALLVRPSDLTVYRKPKEYSDGEPEYRSGDCIMPQSPSHKLSRKERVFRIDKTADSDEMLDTALHEAIHAAFPFLNEEWVDEPISDIAKFLVKLGYRRKGHDD